MKAVCTSSHVHQGSYFKHVKLDGMDVMLCPFCLQSSGSHPGPGWIWELAWPDGGVGRKEIQTGEEEEQRWSLDLTVAHDQSPAGHRTELVNCLNKSFQHLFVHAGVQTTVARHHAFLLVS